MTLDEKINQLKTAPRDACGYGRLGREVAEEADTRLAAMEIACRVYARIIEENRAHMAEFDAARGQLGAEGYAVALDGGIRVVSLDEAIRLLQHQRGAEADLADERQRLLTSSDDLVRRADLIIHDLLLMCRSKALNVDLPDVDAWIEDSREAINRSLE